MPKTAGVDLLPIETELKLQLLPEHIDRFRGSNVLAESALEELALDNVYYDTSDHLLQRHGMALRLRQVGGHWLQTLKTQGVSRGAVRRRGEWETPARVVRGRGRIDVARFMNSPLTALLQKHQGRSSLVPIFQTHVTRTVWSIQRGSAAVEVALDVGEIEAEYQQQTLREAICEIELELKGGARNGESAVLLELALELIDANGRAPLVLVPVTRSKAERGYQLVSRETPSAVKASAKAIIGHVLRGATTATALRSVVTDGLAVLSANVEHLLRHDDAEYVHQARVALRRVRSAVRLFDRDQCDMPQSLAQQFRWFGRTLGETRDWDVITEETLPSLTESIGVDATEALIARADRKRQRARQKVRAAARTVRYSTLVLDGEKWCLTTASTPPRTLRDAAARDLQRACKKLFKEARFFGALTSGQRHQVRILAKRLRYALDLFAVALPKQTTARYIDALSELQDVLGLLNDASVAAAVLPQLTKSARTKKSVQQWVASLEPRRVSDIEVRLLKLSRLGTPWA